MNHLSPQNRKTSFLFFTNKQSSEKMRKTPNSLPNTLPSLSSQNTTNFEKSPINRKLTSKFSDLRISGKEEKDSSTKRKSDFIQKKTLSQKTRITRDYHTSPSSPFVSHGKYETHTFNSNGRIETIQFNEDKVVGKGSFGVVFMGKVLETGENVAIKKVYQDKRYKNRELQIMKMLKHRNVCDLRHYFYCSGEKQDDVYLCLVLEFMPDTVYRFCTSYTSNKQYMEMIFVKLFIYQLCRSLNYLHRSNICHRDIKPQNLLIDPVNGILKLCDFGSAKQLIPNEPNVSYICSRYYRAPELLFNSTKYTTAIDMWSVGCVMGELLIGRPLFPGVKGVDQLVKIIRILGTPKRSEIEAMNKKYVDCKLPQVERQQWSKIPDFARRRPKITEDCYDLLSQFLQYDPTKRIRAVDALAHPFFDELRDPKTRLPNGRPLPELFDFAIDELDTVSHPSLKEKIIPQHLRK
jgi:serine/threonine protein kinase